MKKILGTVLLSAIAFTGCLKDNNDSQKELQPVLPGMYLYDYARSQNNLSMQPANVGVRLAILLAEAAKQEKSDLTKVLDGEGKSVMQALFTKSVKIEGKTEDPTLEEGAYRITFNSGEQMYDGSFLKGSMIVKTGGVALAEADSQKPWEVEPEPGFRIVLLSGSIYPVEQTFHLADVGLTHLFANGDGSYSASLKGIRLNIDKVERYSDWEGLCRFRPEGPSLAYSDCKGKDFTVTIGTWGTTIYSLTAPESPSIGTKMTFKLSDGKFLYGGRAFTGTVVCSLPGFGDYDTATFPGNEVKVVWTIHGNTFSRVIYYAGYVYPKQ